MTGILQKSVHEKRKNMEMQTSGHPRYTVLPEICHAAGFKEVIADSFDTNSLSFIDRLLVYKIRFLP